MGTIQIIKNKLKILEMNNFFLIVFGSLTFMILLSIFMLVTL